jgi:hypothetical protein
LAVRAKILLLVFSLVVSLTVAEVVLRSRIRLWTIHYPPICWRPDLYQRFDPYGYRLWPSRRMRHLYPVDHPRALRITSNSDGFRSRRELRPGDERTRIVVLGDSMVFGMGVEEPERFTELLEAREPRWRVENLGMTGFGPDLMVRALETVGLDPKPDVVVLGMFSHDVYRVAPEAQGVGFPIPRFELRDGLLVTVPYPEPPPWRRLRLVQGLRYAYWRYTSATFPLTAAILERFVARAERDGFVPGIAFLPGVTEGFDDRRRRAFLQDWAEARGAPFIDLTEPLAAAGGARLYIAGDGHWNPDGHRAVADLVHRFIAGLLGRRERARAS